MKIDEILNSLRNEISGHERDIEKSKKEIINYEQTIYSIRNNINNDNIFISRLKEAIETINKGIESEHEQTHAANDIKIQAKIKSLDDDEFIEFKGNDYCTDECRGWDGKAKRCDCGNRRLCWRVDDDEVYPEAL